MTVESHIGKNSLEWERESLLKKRKIFASSKTIILSKSGTQLQHAIHLRSILDNNGVSGVVKEEIEGELIEVCRKKKIKIYELPRVSEEFWERVKVRNEQINKATKLR